MATLSRPMKNKGKSIHRKESVKNKEKAWGESKIRSVVSPKKTVKSRSSEISEMEPLLPQIIDNGMSEKIKCVHPQVKLEADSSDVLSSSDNPHKLDDQESLTTLSDALWIQPPSEDSSEVLALPSYSLVDPLLSDAQSDIGRGSFYPEKEIALPRYTDHLSSPICYPQLKCEPIPESKYIGADAKDSEKEALKLDTTDDQQASRLPVKEKGGASKDDYEKTRLSGKRLRETLLVSGTDVKYLNIIAEEDLFLPEPHCHLEIRRNLSGMVYSIESVKDSTLTSKSGKPSFFIGGRWHGIRKTFHENGTLKSEGRWVDGVENGVFTNYGDDGVKISELHMKKGKKDGPCILYYPNGSKKLEHQFKNGKEDGDCVYYYPSGRIKTEGRLKKGVQDGYYIFYYESGGKKSEGYFENGKPHGPSTTFHENGKLSSIANYKNGVKEGIEEWFDNSGERIGVEYWISEKDFGEKAKPLPLNDAIFRKIIESGVQSKCLFAVPASHLFLPETGCHLEVQHYQNGCVHIIESVENNLLAKKNGKHSLYGRIRGIRKVFNEKGMLSCEGVWDEAVRMLGPRSGVCTKYGSKGFVKAEQRYKGGLRDGFATYYDEDGIKERECYFEKGTEHGLDVYYHKNGNVLRKVNWEFGVKVGDEEFFDDSGNRIGLNYWISEKDFGKKAKPLSVNDHIFRQLLEMGMEEQYFVGVPANQLFLPGPKCHLEIDRFFSGSKCHLEIDRFFSGSISSINSVKNSAVAARNGDLTWNSKLHGLQKIFYENGSLKGERSWVNYQKEGPFIQYFSNGMKQFESQFRGGLKDGLCVEYYPNGKKKSEIQFKRGVEDGLGIFYDQDGDKISEIHFKEGKRDGFSVFYRKNGDKKRQCQFKYGREHGTDVFFNTECKVSNVLHWVNGEVKAKAS